MSTSESEDDAPSSTDSKIVAQLKDKYNTSTKRSEQVQIFTILPQLECKRNRSIVWSIKLHG
jgi:hypothetical protein